MAKKDEADALKNKVEFAKNQGSDNNSIKINPSSPNKGYQDNVNGIKDGGADSAPPSDNSPSKKDDIPSDDNLSKKDELSKKDGLRKNSDDSELNAGQKKAKQAANKALDKLGEKGGLKGKLISKFSKTKFGQKILNFFIKHGKVMILSSIFGPFLGLIITVVLIVVISIYPIMFAVEFLDKAATAIAKVEDRFENFITEGSWADEETNFYDNLKKQGENYKNITGEDLDIPLVISTIQYDNMVSPDAFFDESNDTASSGSFLKNSSYVNYKETAAFYSVANDMLGSPYTLVPGEKKLVGHMLDVDVEWVNVSFNDATKYWNGFVSYIDYTVSDTLKDDNFTCIGPITCTKSFLGLKEKIEDYAIKYNDILAYPDFQTRNLIYEAKEFLDDFDDDPDELNNYENIKDDASADKSGIFLAPKITMKVNLEKYKKYLVELYLPYNVQNTSQVGNYVYTTSDYEQMADEIFSLRDYYNYLMDDNSISSGNCEYQDSGSTTVENNFGYVKNLYIKVTNSHCPVIYYVPFKEYIIGVVYREIGASKSTPEEALKANIIAAKSFTLGFSHKLQYDTNGVPYIVMPNDANHQVYCNIYEGCDNKACYSSNRKSKLSSEDLEYISKVYDEVENEYLYSTSKKRFIGYFRSTKKLCDQSSSAAGQCLGQNDSKTAAKNGEDYKTILSNAYTINNIGLLDISTNAVSSGNYICKSYGGISGNIYSSHPPVYDSQAEFLSNIDYKYWKNNKGDSTYGQCVWYAKGRMLQILSYSNIPEDIKKKRINSLKNTYGNGRDYYNNPSSKVFQKSKNIDDAQPGSIVSWSGDGYGHVAIVEDVERDSNGKVKRLLISEGWGSHYTANYSKKWWNVDRVKSYRTSSGQRRIFNGYVYLLG